MNDTQIKNNIQCKVMADDFFHYNYFLLFQTFDHVLKIYWGLQKIPFCRNGIDPQ